MRIPGARGRRGGYLYVAVLTTSVIVSAMGMAAISVALLDLRAAQSNADWAAAQSLARSAIEDAVLQIDKNAAWRTTFTHNVEYPTPARTLAGGSYTFKLLDDDGNLADEDADNVRVVGIGRAGQAVVAESVRLYPSGAPLSCLEASLCCRGDITVGMLINVTTDQLVSSNGNVSASNFGASITGNVEAVGTISGTISGTKKSGIAARKLPDRTVFDYYKDNGTWIPLANLPLSGSKRQIQRCVLSPSVNPFGPSGNGEGIYVIDCAGAQIEIRDCRILGTLVLLNPASNSSVDGSLRWDAAVGNYPALLVDGSVEMRHYDLDIDEAALGVNFNPAGAPYSGSADTDTSDKYPSEIKGLVYCSGTFTLAIDLGQSAIRGVVVADSITANSPLKLNYRDMYIGYPPPGFGKGNPMKVSPGSWRREAL